MPTATLLCKECKFENEPERVYCHNCGAKLDRALLPPEAVKREDPVEVQRRLQRMTSPTRGAGARQFKNLIVSLAVAALLAAVIQALRPPPDRPNLSAQQVENARLINDELLTAQTQADSKSLAYTEDSVNAYLQNSVHPKKGQASFYGAQYEKSWVHFRDRNVCQVTVEYSLFGLPLCPAAAYQVSIEGGKLRALNIGGSIGRLPIPAIIMKYVETVLTPFLNLERADRKLVEEMQSITFSNGQVQMVTKPGG